MLATLVYFFTFFLLLFWFPVFVIGLITLLVAVFTKNDVVRAICVVLCLGIAGTTLVHWLNVERFDKQAIAEAEQRKAGVYTVDLTKSDLGTYDSELYKDLVVSLQPDNTFSFNRSVPFLTGTKGTWRYVQGSDIAYAEFNFQDADLPEHKTFQFDADGQMLSIYTPLSKYEQPQVALLYFVRKSASLPRTKVDTD